MSQTIVSNRAHRRYAIIILVLIGLTAFIGLLVGFKESTKAVCDAIDYVDIKCRWKATQAVILSICGAFLVLALSLLEPQLPIIRRSLDGLYRLGGVIAALFMIAMLSIIFAQMGARWNGIAFPGSTNYAGYCMAGASFFGLAYALNSSSHIRVSVFLTALGRHRYWAELWCFAIGALLATYFARYAIKATILSEKLNDVSQGQDATPLWIPQLAMCAGTVLLALALWDNLFHMVLYGKSNITEERMTEASADA